MARLRPASAGPQRGKLKRRDGDGRSMDARAGSTQSIRSIPSTPSI
jgi:hypothetical protein